MPFRFNPRRSYVRLINDETGKQVTYPAPISPAVVNMLFWKHGISHYTENLNKDIEYHVANTDIFMEADDLIKEAKINLETQFRLRK